MAIKTLAHFSPGRTILLSIFVTIIIGTLLLALPIARNAPIRFIDLLFTATSATCVTGMFTVPIDQFTTFGHAVIMCLIQIGGLGLITMTLFIMSLFVNLGFTTQLMAGQMLEIEALHHLKKILAWIIGITITTELLGACCIFFVLYPEHAFGDALFLSLFHAVSAFCNAGISIFPGDMAGYKTNSIMLITTMLLVFCGGFGFLTWRELFHNLSARIKGKRVMFSLQTKLIVIGTAISILFATVLFWILEQDNAFGSLGGFYSGLNALFHAVAMRSAGYLTVPIDQLQLATLLLIMFLSFIGSAPSSTGSGIKITTFIILIAAIKAGLHDKQAVEIKGRRIARDQIHKTITIIALSFFGILISLFFLLITEEKATFLELTLETFSALTNLGLSTGSTQYLSLPGKLFIMCSMLIGRIGSLTLILALKKTKRDVVEFSYPEERVMLG